MQTIQEPSVASPSPIDAARMAIWRLYQEGYVDEDMATASLLAVDLGTRRTKRQQCSHDGGTGMRPASLAA